MQRIERYGVIALVLLLVTIAAVSFWDEGTPAEQVASAPEEPRAEAPVRRERPTRSLPKAEERAPRREASVASGLPAVTPAGRTASSGTAPSAPRRVSPERAPITTPAPSERAAAQFQELPARVVESPRPRPVEPEPLVVPAYDEETARGASTLAGRRDPAPAPTASERRRNEMVGGVAPAPAPEQPSSEPARTARTYRVQPGDSLSRIASRELGSSSRMKELMGLNSITDPDRIFVGQELKLPGGAAPAAVVARPVAASAPAAGEGVYVVRAGEVLGAIAQRELGRSSRYAEIVSLNPGLDPDRITEGQRLRMPADWSGTTGAVVSAVPRTPARREATAPRRGKVR